MLHPIPTEWMSWSTKLNKLRVQLEYPLWDGSTRRSQQYPLMDGTMDGSTAEPMLHFPERSEVPRTCGADSVAVNWCRSEPSPAASDRDWSHSPTTRNS